MPSIRIVGRPDLEVDRVALCTGSGGSLVPHFLNTEAQVYVTGDIKYHEARDVENAGRGLIDVGHFASERQFIQAMVDYLKRKMRTTGWDVVIEGYAREQDPFTIL